MITGSHHQQIYWYATGRNRLLGQLPGAYLIAEQRWIPRRTAVLHPPTDPVFSETGHWNSTSVSPATRRTASREFDTPFGSQPVETQTVQTRRGRVRHRVRGVPRAGRSARRRESQSAAPLRASTCSAPRRRDDGAADAAATATLVAGLRPVPRHLGVLRSGAASARPTARGLPYRPGDELTATRFLAQPTRNADAPAMQALLADDPGFISDSFWPDGMVRVSGREYNGLIESPCFVNATDDDAHAVVLLVPHDAQDRRTIRGPSAEWANDQLAPGMDGNAACAAVPPADRATREPDGAHEARRPAPRAAPATTATCRTRPTGC